MGKDWGKSGIGAESAETCRIIVEDVTQSTTNMMTSPEMTLPEVFSPTLSEERRRSSASSDTTTVYGGSRRGSTLSMDTRRSSGGGTTEFWVPASVIQRTRSRSLVPPDQISYSDDNDNVKGKPIRTESVILSNYMFSVDVISGGSRFQQTISTLSFSFPSFSFSSPFFLSLFLTHVCPLLLICHWM